MTYHDLKIICPDVRKRATVLIECLGTWISQNEAGSVPSYLVTALVTVTRVHSLSHLPWNLKGSKLNPNNDSTHSGHSGGSYSLFFVVHLNSYIKVDFNTLH